MNNIIEMKPEHWQKVWDVIRPVFRKGDTYVFDPKISESEAKNIWYETCDKTFICFDENNEILGTYYLKKNQPGFGSHVCNCGYIVAESARRKGVALRMCKHSQSIAKKLGFKAMQFNFVVSTNYGAIKLWEKLGFKVIGTIPKGFEHPTNGYVDAKIMYKWLNNDRRYKNFITNY